MRKSSLFIVFTLFTRAILGQQSDSAFIKQISNEILTNGKAYENLRYLTKNIGARLAGSPGMVESEQWGLKVMQESGADKALGKRRKRRSLCFLSSGFKTGYKCEQDTKGA